MSIVDASEMIEQLSFDNFGLDESHLLKVQKYGAWSNGEVEISCSCGLIDLTVFPLENMNDMKRHYRDDIRKFIEEYGIDATMPENSVYGDAAYIIAAILHHADEEYTEILRPENSTKAKELMDGVFEDNYADVVLASDANASLPIKYSPEKDIDEKAALMDNVLAGFHKVDTKNPAEVNLFAKNLSIESERAAAAVTRANLYNENNPNLRNVNYDAELYEAWQTLISS